MAAYGRGFTLASASNSSPNAPTVGVSRAGTQGVLSYSGICQLLKQGYRSTYDTQWQAPYAVQGDQWIGYDNVDSIRAKVKYVKQNQYGGSMIWTIDMDDFNGSQCGQGNYPLINILKSG